LVRLPLGERPERERRDLGRVDFFVGDVVAVVVFFRELGAAEPTVVDRCITPVRERHLGARVRAERPRTAEEGRKQRKREYDDEPIHLSLL
jgi:hypothetical protein